MELRTLKYFLTVAREENFTRTAELLHITQPTLSRQLMQLEEEVGAQLFNRLSRKITLTQAGLILRRLLNPSAKFTPMLPLKFTPAMPTRLKSALKTG